MTKETLERAKTLDGNIERINKALNVLSNQELRITNITTGFNFTFDKLDKDTRAELLIVMDDVLTKRKSLMIKDLEEL